MSRTGTFLFLGTGGSMGVPVVTCKCAVCHSQDPHNKRFRCSALVTVDDTRLLIDAGPDFRSQALKYNVDAIDGLLLTHAHQDHTGGIDDLRVFCFGNRTVPCLLSRATLRDIHSRFGYLFEPKSDPTMVVTHFDSCLLPEGRGKIVFEGVSVHYFNYFQAKMEVNGFRFGDLSYVTDIYNYPESIFEDLRGTRHLIVSALRHKPSTMHFTVDVAVDFAKRVGAEHTWLTHISHDLDHEQTNAYLPSNIRMAYDGLELQFSL